MPLSLDDARRAFEAGVEISNGSIFKRVIIDINSALLLRFQFLWKEKRLFLNVWIRRFELYRLINCELINLAVDEGETTAFSLLATTGSEYFQNKSLVYR